MNKFIYLFAILGCLALATAQIVEPDLSNDAAPAEEAGILTPFENDLPVDGDSDYYKNGEDYGGIYEGYFENAEGFVGTADDLNDDFGYVEDPIIAEESIGLIDVAEPIINEEDSTIGEAVVEPSEDPFQFNHIPNSALDNSVGEDFYESWEAIVDSPDDIISEEDFVDYPDALVDFEEAVVGEPEALVDLEEGIVGQPDDLVDFEAGEVDYPEALVDLEEAVVGEPEALVDLEEGVVGEPDDLLVDFEAGEADYPEALIESGEDFSEALIDYPDDLTESGDDVSEFDVDYPDNIAESGEDVTEALVDYPDNLVESGEDFSEALVDYPDDLFESEEVTVDIPEARVDDPDDIVEEESSDDFGEADYPDGLIEEEAQVDEPEDITDAGETDEPEDVTDAGETDEPEDVTDAGEVDEPEDEEIGFAVDSKPIVELDPRVLDTNEEESEENDMISSNDSNIEPDNLQQGDILVAEGIDEVAAEPTEEQSKNFLGKSN